MRGVQTFHTATRVITICLDYCTLSFSRNIIQSSRINQGDLKIGSRVQSICGCDVEYLAFLLSGTVVIVYVLSVRQHAI